MNNLLFRLAELEEQFEKKLVSDQELERSIGACQLKTLQLFKYYPIRSHEESQDILNKLNQIFKSN